MTTDERRPTVLVTGGAGFIGSALCSRLLAAGRRVVAYDDLSRGRRDLLPSAVQLIEGDIRDRERLRAAIGDTTPDALVHLAAMHFIPDCVARPQETVAVNVEGTRCVLDSCRGSSIRGVVFASSGAVYEPSDEPCVEGHTALRPLEVYGESKLAAEDLARAFQRDTAIPTSVVRFFNAIGRNETNPHVIPHIFESLQSSDVIRLGNMAPRRDYIDTRDLADAMLAVLDAAHGFSVLNVGTGVACSVSEIVDLIGSILGRRITVVGEPARMRATERMLLVADISRIRHATGWTPRISLKQSLKDLVHAYGLQTQPSIAD
ncbi:MAG: NAD-dependent epimerase/dehydratase family protein [Burkholderiales bacterium]